MITFFCPASSFNLRFNILRLSNLASNMYSRLFTAPSATSQRCDTPFWAAFWLVQIQNTEQDAMSEKNSPIRGFNSLCWQDDALKITKPLNQFDYVRSGFCRLWKKAIKIESFLESIDQYQSLTLQIGEQSSKCFCQIMEAHRRVEP
jgi:hypothetical protein